MAGFRKEVTDLVRPRLQSPPGMTQQLVDGIDRLFDEAGVARDDGAAPKFPKAPGAPSRRQLTDLLRPLLAPPGMTQELVEGLDAIWDRCGVPKDDAAPQAPAAPPAPPASATAPAAGAAVGLANEDAFFAAVRTAFGPLRDSDQMPGIRAILAACGAGKWGVAFTANALGTAWLETNKTMQPVAEAYYLKNKVQDLDAWRRRKLRYYPYYGRGYVQLTWDYNYKKADSELGLNGTLLANLDRALEQEIAARVMVRGMEEGWFTAKSLGKYLPAAGAGTAEQHKQARRVINGTDRWEDLSAYAMKFQSALQAGGWG